MRRPKISTGFSLIELVIVVVIIAIIGAIAIPKMSRGSAGAADSSLTQDLAEMRSAMDLYNGEHPQAQLNSSMTAAAVVTALTSYSDAAGVNFSATRNTTSIYGPYLKSVPAMPVGTNKSDATVTVAASPGTGSNGWCFTGTDFKCNDPTTDVDVSNNPYNGY